MKSVNMNEQGGVWDLVACVRVCMSPCLYAWLMVTGARIHCTQLYLSCVGGNVFAILLCSWVWVCCVWGCWLLAVTLIHVCMCSMLLDREREVGVERMHVDVHAFTEKKRGA